MTELEVLRAYIKTAREHNRNAIYYRVLKLRGDAIRHRKLRDNMMEYARELRDIMRFGYPND